MDLRKRFGAMKARLIALNGHDPVMQLTEGSSDLLIAYHHLSQPLQLKPERYELQSLKREALAQWAFLREAGRALAARSPTG